MNFLSKTLSSFTGYGIPYNFGEELAADSSVLPSIWKVYDGTKKDDGTPCTIFSFDIKAHPELSPLALNALRKLRAIRLPGILKVIETIENESNLYIISERVKPLINVIKAAELSSETLLYIIHSVAVALKFINSEASSVLGYLDLNSIFVNSRAEIKLGGFELLTNLKSDPDQPLFRFSSKFERFSAIEPPEVTKNGIDALRGTKAIKLDSWRLGVLIFQLFNSSTRPNLNEISVGTNVPRELLPYYNKLVSTSLTQRPTVQQFIQSSAGVFGTPLIQLYRELDEFDLKSDEEKSRIFELLESTKQIETIPGFKENRVLPELIKLFTQSPSNSQVSLGYILAYSEALTNEQFTKYVKSIVLKAFSSPDRSIRLLLLNSLPSYIGKLDRSDISDKIFVNFVTGFSDSNPAIREETLKATLYIAPKLSDRQLNNELLRYLAKVQSDEKPEIRTNTTILLGKIAEYLNRSSRPTVLATAFGKALKDPFVHSRIAALLALSSSIEYFTPEIISNKILTVIAPSLLDKSSKVREEAQKAFDLFFQKIKEEAAKLPLDKNDEYAGAVEEVTADVQNFGISFSGAFNKFASGIGGSLNTDVNNVSSENSTRSGTPVVVESFQKQAIKPTQNTITKKVNYDDWGDEEDIDVDEGWDTGDAIAEETLPQVQKAFKPKVTQLATESNHTKSKTTAAPRKGLQLKAHKSKLKLDLKIEDDEDGWGNGW